MPKDRSFAHRMYQSNIDLQRNRARFNIRPPKAPEPKANFWQRTKAFFSNLWAKIKVIVND